MKCPLVCAFNLSHLAFKCLLINIVSLELINLSARKSTHFPYHEIVIYLSCLAVIPGDMSGAFDDVIVVGEVVETEEYELSPPPSPPARPCSPNMPALVLPGPPQVVRRQFSDRSARAGWSGERGS